MILDRYDFIKYFESMENGNSELTERGGALWFPETDPFLNIDNSPPSEWFINISPKIVSNRNNWSDLRDQYWEWCSQNCKGTVRCYSSSEEEEWWGFTNKQDIVWWVVKWG